MQRYKFQFLLIMNLVFLFPLYALETLSYSGRLVQTNGSPVLGPVTIRAELAYTNALTTVLCTEDIPNVTLTKGVFHVKLNLDCSASGLTLTQVLSQVPNGESIAIQIVDVTNSKNYNFQALHAVPFSNVASQLVQMGASDNQVLKWNNSAKKWEPGNAGGGGTVTTVSGTLPISVANGSSTPVVSIAQANTTTNGFLSSTDWNTFNNKEGTLAAGTTAQYYRGDKSWQTLNTDAVSEGSKLYFENSRVLGVPLTGFVVGSGAVAATDTILQGFSKTQGQINSLATADTHFLLKDSADTLSGNVALTGTITSDPVLGDIVVRGTPIGMTSAVSKSYVDAGDDLLVSKSGDTMTGILTLDSDLKIKGGSNYVSLRGHASSGNYNFILPSSAGSSGQFLQTDGSGNLSWVAQSSSATPSGSAGGDLAGTYPNPTVPGLASKISTTLTSGNILIGNASNVATAQSLTGDAGLSNAGVLTLSNTSVTPGTYKSVTVDSKGRITSGTNPTTLAGYGISDTLVTGISFTAPLTNTGTASVPILAIPAATASVDGYLTAADFTLLSAKQSSITSASAINTGSITSHLQDGVILNPHNTSSGNTGEIRFKELAVNGSNYIGFKSPDNIASNLIFTLPQSDGSNGQVLTTNASGVLTWSTVATGSTTLVGDIGGTIGANTIGSGKVTLNHLSATGTKDNSSYLRGDNTFSNFMTDVRAATLTGLSTATNAVISASDTVLSSLGKLQKQITDFAVSTVGGDLSGNLPNPTVAKIQGRAVTSTAPLSGQVIKYNTSTPAWEPAYVLVGDLKSSALGNLFPGSGCAANQTLYYSVVGDAFSCVDIGALDASKITTGTIADARLPASVKYWESATGGINYAGGNVGIGTTTPATTLDINGTVRLAKNSSAPYTCDNARDGAIALTGAYTTCTCRNGTGWVSVNDGVTSCQWTPGAILGIAATTGAPSAMNVTGVTLGTTAYGSDVTFTVSNSGSVTSAALAFSLSNTTSFAFNGGTCTNGSTTLSPGANCTIIVRPKNTLNESFSGNLSVSTGNAPSIAISGTASGFLETYLIGTFFGVDKFATKTCASGDYYCQARRACEVATGSTCSWQSYTCSTYPDLNGSFYPTSDPNSMGIATGGSSSLNWTVTSAWTTTGNNTSSASYGNLCACYNYSAWTKGYTGCGVGRWEPY